MNIERWAVLHIDFDDCIYRPFDPITGEWTTPPLNRADAITRCEAQGLTPSSTMLRLGNAILDLNHNGIKDGTGRWHQSSALRLAKDGNSHD